VNTETVYSGRREADLVMTSTGSWDGRTWWSYNDLAPRGGLLTNGKRHHSISGWTNTASFTLEI